MKKFITGTLLLFIVQLAVMTGMVQASPEKAANCSTYARNRAEIESSSGGSVMRNGMRGAAGGALFGALVGGSRGARRGAFWGGGMGFVGGGIRASEDRSARFQM